MVDREMTRLVYTLQQEVGDLRKQVKTLQSAPALRNASIENTGIPVMDGDGNVVSVIGRQADGSSGVSVRRSPFQPMPSAPILNAGEQAGTCNVEWDGETHFDDPVPQIHGRIEIWAGLLDEGQEPTTAPIPGAVRVGTIRERDGGEVLVALPRVGTWAVWLRMVGADGVTVSLWSPVATVEIAGKFNEADFEERLLAFANGELLDDAAYNNLMARLGEFLVIRAGSLASNDIEAMRIVSSLIESSVIEGRDADGKLTYRLDGMDNLLMGRIHAGMVDGLGITLDYGEQVINIGLDDDGEPDEVRTWMAPYLAFETDQPHTSRPRITVDPDNGGIRIFPGSLPNTSGFRARLSVSGDARANRFLGNSSRMSSGQWVVGDDYTDILGGLGPDDGAIRITGAFAPQSSSRQMLIRGNFGDVERTVSSGGFYKTSTTYVLPAESGTRMPVISTNLGPNSYDQSRVVATSTSSRTASGFNAVSRQLANNSDNTGSASYKLSYLAWWEA